MQQEPGGGGRAPQGHDFVDPASSKSFEDASPSGNAFYYMNTLPSMMSDRSGSGSFVGTTYASLFGDNSYNGAKSRAFNESLGKKMLSTYENGKQMFSTFTCQQAKEMFMKYGEGSTNASYGVGILSVSIDMSYSVEGYQIRVGVGLGEGMLLTNQVGAGFGKPQSGINLEVTAAAGVRGIVPTLSSTFSRTNANGFTGIRYGFGEFLGATLGYTTNVQPWQH
jgi:hypothetical protein